MADILLKRSTGGVYFSTPINEGAKRVRKLMADDYITLPLNTQNPLDIRLGDYVDVPNEGRFCIIEKQVLTIDEDSGGYNYTLKFDAQYRKWGNKIFKYQPQSGSQECSWFLTASISVHAEQVQIAINALGKQDASYKYNGTKEWVVEWDSSVDEEVAKPITFDNINILDGISAIAEAFECEWWVEDNKVIFGRCEFGSEIELSRELNITSITRSDTGEKTANRIYPFGSNENIPPKYNKELTFDVSRVMSGSGNALGILDNARPILPSWFDEKMVEKEEFFISIPFKGFKYGDKWVNTNKNDYPVFDVQEVEFDKISEGKLKLNLKDFSTDVAAYFAKGSYGRFDYEAQVRLAYKTEYKWESDKKHDIESNLGNTITSVPVESIDHTMMHYIASTSVVKRDGNFQTLEFEDDTIEIEIPTEINVIKKVLLFDLEGAVIGTTDESVKISTSDALKKALYFELRVFVKDNGKLSCSATDTYIRYDEDKEPIYRVNGISIKFLTGKLMGEPLLATYDSAFRYDTYGIVLNDVSDSDLIEIGDKFRILNINEALVPSSYYTYTNEKDEYDVVNAIADERLKLPKDKGSYIDAYRYDGNGNKVYLWENGYDSAIEMPLSEAIEDVVIFEDVRPDYDFEVVEAWNTSEEVTDADGTKRIVFKFYINDDLFTADNQFQERYQLEGTELAIRFSSGKLNGMKFGLECYNEPDKPTRWEVIVDEETNLPNQFYAPEVADTFTISGLNVAIIGEQYVPNAELELYEKSCEYVKKTNLDASAYECIMKSEVMVGDDALVLNLGRKVLLKEDAYFNGGRSSRVIGYEYPLDIPYDNPKYTIGEKASYSRLGDIESKLESLELSKAPTINGVVSGGGTTSSSASSIYVIGTNDTTTPSDKNVLSALRAISDFVSRKKQEVINYLWRFAKGVEIGQFQQGVKGANIDANGDAEVESLTSRSRVKSSEVVADSIHTTDYVQGALLGTGGAIYQLKGATYAEFDYLTARKGATFAELIIQEYSSIGGALVISQANGEIESITERYDATDDLDYFDITIKDWDKNPQFVVGDLVRCQYWDFSTDEYVHYWVEVKKVLSNGISLLVGDFTQFPKEGNKLVQMGNTTDTSRQGCILLTTENSLPRMAMLDGINEPKIYNTKDKTNYKGIYGSLENFVDPYTGKKLSGYGMWGENVHLHGDLILSSTNKSVADSIKDVGNGRNLLLGTNRGVENWKFNSSLSSTSNNPYTMLEIDYNGAKGMQMLNRTNGSATYEIFYYPLRLQFIKKGKTYHLSFDMMQSINHDGGIEFRASLSTTGGGEHLTNIVKVVSKDINGLWLHYDVEFTAIADGSTTSKQVVYFNINADSRYWNDFAIANLKLEEGVKATEWTSAPEDVEQTMTEFKVTTEGLTSRVSTTEGKVTQIEQNAENISLKVDNLNDGLTKTGIDIEKNVISVSTKQFEVKNNQTGEITASVDDQGRLSANVFIAKAGVPMTTINENKDGYARWYYPNTSNVAIEIGWDEAQSSLIRVYGKDGTPLWKLGTDQAFLEPDFQEWSEVKLRFISNDYQTAYDTLYNNNSNLTLDTYYQHNFVNRNAITYASQSDENSKINGWFTNMAEAMYADVVSSGKKYRTIQHYINGVLDDSVTIIFYN